MSPATATKITKISVDLSGVEDRKGGGKAAHVPEGDYILEVVDAEVRSKKDDKTSKYVSWQLKIVEPPLRGSIYHITSLKPENLWSLRNFLADLLEKDIPKRALSIDLIKYKGKKIGATLEDDSYTNETKGTTTVKSSIAGTFPASQYAAPGAAADEDAELMADDDEEEEELETIDEDEDI